MTEIDINWLSRQPPKNAKKSYFDEWAAARIADPAKWQAGWDAARGYVRTYSCRRDRDAYFMRIEFDPPHAKGAAFVQLFECKEMEELGPVKCLERMVEIMECRDDE